METWVKKLQSTPIIARVAPLVIFLACMALKDLLGLSPYWTYLFKTLIGAWTIWAVWPVVTEARWAFSWEAVIVGIAVFVMWVGGYNYFPTAEKPGDPVWNPFTQFGAPQAWFFVMIHLLGSTFVVPPIEEMFYRSFLYRYLIRLDFQNVPFNTFHAVAFFITAGIFCVTHLQWLAALLCGFAYQWLVIRKNRLGDAMTAHAITNFLLGIWVIWKNEWHYW